MTDQLENQLIVYADYVCPFCRLGNATLRGYLADRSDRGVPALDVEWRPFDLRADERTSDGTIQAVSSSDKAEYVRSRWPEVQSLADQYGIEMTMDVDAYLRIDARNAQLVALGLKRDDPDRFRPFHDAVFDALWTDTRDVGDPVVLRELAASIGIDPESVVEWITDEALTNQFSTATETAVSQGVRGVPTIVYDGRAVYGSQPPPAYRELIEGSD